jgi:predicted phosphoribosyltransferase
MFKDRKEAGFRLGEALRKFKGQEPVVLSIPKGGLEIGYEVAKTLQCPLSVLITRKLPFPEYPESGFGAVAEDGSTFIVPGMDKKIPQSTFEDVYREQVDEIKRRVSILRGGKPLPDITGKTVILTDDGIAMGSTMMASINFCRKRNDARLIIASPVASPATASAIGKEVDDAVILVKPGDFQAVAQVYDDWYDVSDMEALSILEDAKNEGYFT